MAMTIVQIKTITVGLNYPPFHPNCRTTTVPFFPEDYTEEALAKRTRIARDELGYSYSVPADLSYPEWKAGLKKQEDGTTRYKV